MVRGTTPTLNFTIPIDVSTIAVLSVAFSQAGTVILDKTLDDCTVSGHLITLGLTQAETLMFTADVPVDIQIRCRLNDGVALASNIINTTTGRILKDGVI